jgi:hypothetical protein
MYSIFLDVIGINCDSTFQFIGKDSNNNNIEIIFAPENKNGKRLDFSVSYKEFNIDKTLIKEY